MADITDPVIIAFSDRRLRPRAEMIRDLLILLRDDEEEFTTNVASRLNVHVGGDILLDGSPADGRNPLTKTDIQADLVDLAALIVELTGQESLRSKFTVRPPRLGQ